MISEKERIEQIINVKDLTASQLATEIGVNSSNISHILNERNNPSLEIMRKIMERYPEINPDWLILGEGPMLRQINDSQTPSLFAFNDEMQSESVHYESKPVEKVIPKVIESVKKEVNFDTKEVYITEKKLEPQKEIEKIIVYFSDNTFKEYYSK